MSKTWHRNRKKRSAKGDHLRDARRAKFERTHEALRAEPRKDPNKEPPR